MSDLSMTEISKGVWVPRGTPFVRNVVKVPVEDEEEKPYVGLPRRSAGVMNPEDESEDEAVRPLEPVAAFTYEQARERAAYWEAIEKAQHEAAAAGGRRAADALKAAPTLAAQRAAEEAARPLEPVAAFTYEQAREAAYKAEVERGQREEKERQVAAARAAADAVAAEEARWAALAAQEAEEDARRAEEARVAAGKTWAADGGAVNGFGKDHIVAKEKYTGTLWQNAPEKEQPPPFATSWYYCVERWHFVQLGGQCRHRLIIEVELHGGTSLRHILYLDQVKGVLTKSNNREHGAYKVVEEVIIDMRHRSNSFSPEQVRFKFMGSANAMAFHLALIEALDRIFF